MDKQRREPFTPELYYPRDEDSIWEYPYMPGPTAPNSPASSGNLQTLINGRIDDVVAAMEKAQKYLQDIVNKKKKAPLQKTPPQSNIKRNAVKKTVRAVPKKNMKKDALL